MRFAPHAFITTVAVLVGFWVAGAIKLPDVLRGIAIVFLALVAVSAITAARATYRELRLRKLRGDRFIICRARGMIREGDLLKLDTVTREAERVDTSVQ